MAVVQVQSIKKGEVPPLGGMHSVTGRTGDPGAMMMGGGAVSSIMKGKISPCSGLGPALLSEVCTGMFPDVLRYMMCYHGYGKRNHAQRLLRELPEAVKSALAVSDYSVAEGACPHHIRIGKAMREATGILA